MHDHIMRFISYFYELLFLNQTNLLFRYEGSVPVEVCIIDWQFARPSSLATDLCYFMYHCTEADMRNESLDELLSVYVDAYTNCLPKGTACRFTEKELKFWSTWPGRPTLGPMLQWCCLFPWARTSSILTMLLRRRGQKCMRRWCLTCSPRMQRHPEDILTYYFIKVLYIFLSHVICTAEKIYL